MKRVGWQLIFGFSLIVLSVGLYILHFAMFGDAERLAEDLLEYVAFVPIQVLLVTFIIDRLLKEREKRSMLKKMNMVIGAFFSAVGMTLLRQLFAFDRNFYALRKELLLQTDWSEKEFVKADRLVRAFEYAMDSRQGDLEELCGFLSGERDFLLGLLGNSNLLEHEAFTELLWAVTHVAEELRARPDLKGLTNGDYGHISGDLARAYVLLIAEWLAYMKHLKVEYPFLFSLAVRTNPFDPEASAGLK
jgi:hypothetical protein